MKVLIACEFSGIVREAFRKRGHDAWSCDVLDTEIPGQHIKGDVLEILNDGWDMMIAFPPCTHLAVSGARWFETKQVEQRNAIYFFKALWDAPIHKIAIENPIIIQPYYFGDPYKKSTCLWLKNLPLLNHYKEADVFHSKTHVEPEYLVYKSKKNKSGTSKYSHFGKLGKGKGKERSLFPKGIAKAMAEQWGQL